MTEETSKTPFIKQLASSDPRVRNQTLQSIQAYIQSGKSFEQLELLQLWRGLFFSMWHADRPKAQQSLARSFASLLDDLPIDLFLSFDAAFWTTISRDWNSIDALRMDKYLYLVRCYVTSAFRYLRARSWQDGLVDEYLDIVRKYPFNPADPKIPDGLRYHVLDCWVEELDKVDDERNGSAPVELLMKPVHEMQRDSPNKIVRERARECTDDERLKDWLGSKATAKQPDNDGSDDDRGWDGLG